MSNQKTKQASADRSYGDVIGDIEALIRRGSKAAQEDVSSLPGADHDQKTPEQVKGDYPLDPDPMSEATKSTEGKGDGTKAPTHEMSPEETDASQASSEQPGEMPMVTDDENKGAGKQANELLRAIKTAAEELAQSKSGQKKAQEAGGEAGGEGGDGGSPAGAGEAAPPSEDEKVAGKKKKQKYAGPLELSEKVLSKIAAVLLADEQAQADTFGHLTRLTNEKTAEEAIELLNNLGDEYEKLAIEQQAEQDADQLYAQLSKEASELNLTVDQYVQQLQQLDAQISKEAAAYNLTPEQYLAALDRQQAQPVQRRSAPQARGQKQAAAPSRGEKLAQAIIDAAAEDELPGELAAPLPEEEAAEIAIAQMIESGEITPEELEMLVEQLAAEEAMAGGDMGVEGDMIDELVDDAAMGVEGDMGDVPDAVAADAAEAVIPPEKLTGDKLAQLLAKKVTQPAKPAKGK